MRYELIKGTSSKFWQVDLRAKALVLTWGRIGTAGRTLKKTFPTPAAAKAAHDKLVRDKTREGYVETGSAAAPAAPAAPATPALHSFFLHTSHHQFTVEDAAHGFQKFTFATIKDGLETQQHGAVVHLRRAAGEIPIVVEVRTAPPAAPPWPFHVVSEGSFACASGTLAVGSPEAREPVMVPAPKSVLRIQVRQADLDTSDYDGGIGADHYRVLLWPGTATKTRRLASVKLAETDAVKAAGMKLDAVQTLLASADPTDRCHAAVECVRHLRAGDARALAVLARAAKDAAPVVRGVVAAALGVAGQSERAKVLGLLDTLAADESKQVRTRVPEALARLGGGDAAARLLAAISGKDADLARAAAARLGEVEDLDPKDLIPLLAHPAAQTRLAALTAVDRIGNARDWAAVGATGAAVRALVKDKDLAVRKLAAALVEKLGAPLDDLLKLARSPTVKMRESAARALGETRDAAAYDALVKLIGDKDVGVRREAAAGLGALGDQRAVPILAKQLEDGTYNLNWYAARALARLGGPKAVASLFRYVDLADADDKFDYIGREATDALAEMLDVAGGEERADGVSGNIDVAAAAKRARALAASKDERLRERGVTLLEHVPRRS